MAAPPRWRAPATVALVAALTLLSAAVCRAQAPLLPALPQSWTSDQPEQVVLTLRVLIGLAVLSLAPALLMTLTSFTRIIIILSFLRSALGTGQTPPNAVLVGLALFLTLFVMRPSLDAINRQSVQPYLAGEIGYPDALARGAAPLRAFMLRQTRERDLALFYEIAGLPRPRARDDVLFNVLMPAFVISELKSAFQIGFVLFLPFLVIDLAVASALMSMGMLMVPPVMISLPLKILLFVMVDGWYLVTRSVVLSFA